MELVRGNAAVSDMNRDGLGREGGGRLFVNRRQRDWSRGLLSNRGQLNEPLAKLQFDVEGGAHGL